MRISLEKTVLFTLIGVGLLAGLLAPAPGRAAPAAGGPVTGGSVAGGAGSAEALRLPPLRFTDRRLPNGLRVLLVEDHSAPTVSLCIGYHVGGKNDPPDRSGFAHLFEHLMFKGTANLPPESIDRLTEDVGGTNNAFTTEDATVFFEEVPSNYLETLLWAEADRLASLNVDADNFKTERDVVIGEYGQTVLAAPYGMLSVLMDARAYSTHPYRRGVIGSPSELNRATLDDVRRFHSTYYQPDNAVLAVVGDISPQQANTWIDRYFGRIPHSASRIPWVAAVEPPQRAERRSTYTRANVPLPAVAYIYHAVAADSPDAPALEVAAGILASGESSRLYRSLVYEKQAASDVSADADLREQPGVFDFTARLNAGHKPAEAEALLDREIGRMRSAPVSAAELEKAKTQLLAEVVREREGSLGRAITLVLTAIVEGDPGRINSRIERIQRVTAADVMRVMREYLAPPNRTVILYLPQPAKPAQTGPRGTGKSAGPPAGARERMRSKGGAPR